VAGNNCNGGGSKASKRQKVSHQFSGKGGRKQNGGCGQSAAGQGLQQQAHHAIVPDQLKLYSELIRNIMIYLYVYLVCRAGHEILTKPECNGFNSLAPPPTP